MSTTTTKRTPHNAGDRARRKAVLEDAEWMARTGETPDVAARRLGYKEWSSLQRTLHRCDQGRRVKRGASIIRQFMRNAHARGVDAYGRAA